MRIAIHSGTLRGFGSAYVGRSILTALTTVGVEHRFRAWVPRTWPRLSLAPARVACRAVSAGALSKFWLENVEIRRSLERWRADCLFSLGDTSLPGCPVPHVVLVHQAFLAYGPEARGFPIPPRFAAKLALMERYFEAMLRTVRMLTVQTEDMKSRLSARWGIAPEDIVVIPSSPGEIPRFGDVDAREPPSLVYVSGLGPHKNHGVLVEALALLRPSHPDLRLRLTLLPEQVPALVERALSLGVLGCIEFVGPLPRERALREIARATVTVNPSLLESFGLSYYEAMAQARPLVVADRGFAREACGDAALYADPHEPASFATAIRLLLDDEEEARTRASAALARAGEVAVPWEEIGARYLRLLEQVV